VDIVGVIETDVLLEFKADGDKSKSNVFLVIVGDTETDLL